MSLEAYSGLTQTSKRELFANILIGFQWLTINAKSSILDVRPRSKYSPGVNNQN